MRVSFLTPIAGLVAFAVILPLVAFVRSERRAEQVRSLLRLTRPSGSTRATVVALVAIALLVGIGAAQPVVEERSQDAARTDAEAYFAFDTSRSMLASSGPGTPTRFDRAVIAARRMRAQLVDVPVGIASLTDRVLPHVFPTTNPETFESVLRYSIGVDRPPSDTAENRRATNLEATEDFASGNFYRGGRHRLLVVFTDGETTTVGAEAIKLSFEQRNIKTVVMRFWADRERIYTPGGVEAAYEPDPQSATMAEAYARNLGGEAFDETELAGAIKAAQEVLGEGEPVAQAEAIDLRPLSPFVFLAALIPLSFLLLRRNLA